MKYIAAVVGLAVAVSGCKNAAEEAVREHLIDPSSAEFKDVRTCDGNANITVGQVNGKNRMGAYTGFEPFFVEYGIAHFASSASFSEVMERCYATEDPAGHTTTDVAADSEQAKLGSWRTNEDRDPIDDSAVITASLDAESGRARFGEPVTIVARCGSNTTDFYAIWNTYVGDDSNSVYDEYKNVEVRIGDAPAKTERWSVSTDKQATFAGAAVPTLKQMVGKEKLALRLTPYGENPITAVFDLQGIRVALKPIAKECNWEL